MVESSTMSTEGGIALGLLLAYVSSSLFLLRFPTLLHKKKKVYFKARHASHRGGAGERIENTLEAFRHSHQLGTQLFELDCRVTKDGEVVVAHDDELMRICGVNGKISETNYKSLPKIKQTQDLTFMSSFTLQRPGDVAEECEFLLLEDLFREFPEFPMNIDPKSAENVEPIYRIIKRYQKEKSVVWGSFGDDVNRNCYRLDPDIPLIVGLKSLLKIVVLFYVGLLPFFPIKESYLEIPMIREILKNHRGIRSMSKSWTAFIHVFDWLFMNRVLFAHLQRRGMMLYAWVLNTEDQFNAAFDFGFDGVMTDFPSKLSQYLKTNENSPLVTSRSQ